MAMKCRRLMALGNRADLVLKCNCSLITLEGKGFGPDQSRVWQEEHLVPFHIAVVTWG